METTNEFGIRTMDSRTFLAAALLMPAMTWWAALAVSLFAASGMAEYLGSSFLQVIVLVVCPLAAVFLSIGRTRAAKGNWLIAMAGVFLAAVAILASFRNS